MTEHAVKSSTEDIYRSLRRMITSLEILPATRFTETQLCDHFSVSRTPVRAALQKLQSEGLVLVKPKQGCFVRTIDLGQIAQHYDVRVALELGILDALHRIDAEAGLKELATHWHPEKDGYGSEVRDSLKEAEEQFHIQLARLSGNEALLKYLLDVNEQIRVVRLLGWPDEESVRRTYEQHFRLCELMLAGDLRVAQKLMRAHIRKSQENASQITLQQLYENQSKGLFS